jgi:hypothetical protein
VAGDEPGVGAAGAPAAGVCWVAASDFFSDFFSDFLAVFFSGFFSVSSAQRLPANASKISAITRRLQLETDAKDFPDVRMRGLTSRG